MPEYDARAAARHRDSGLRKVSRVTWRAGAAGVAFTAVIGVSLTHHGDALASTQQQGSQQAQQQPGQQRPAQQPPGSIQGPAQPPQQSTGSGQVTSGAS